jgi:ParB/RepB/Spo0J family partition protein
MARAKKAAEPAQDEETAQDAVAIVTVAESAIEIVAYSRLRRAPENVRKTAIDADVESLADDIAAHGLLQSLIGYPFNPRVDNSVVYIVGGGRRLQALQMLRERGLIDDAFAVPVLIRPQAEAIEISLSENLARRDMNPADEFDAFAELMKPGSLSPADLAKRFGFSERYVKQRLRLAGLAEEVLDGLRAGEMTLDAAMAYGLTQSHILQRKIYKAEKKKTWGAHSAQSIRTAIINDQMTTASPLFLFVGEEAYEKAGGGYEDDLFGDATTCSGARKLRDPGIILTVAPLRAEKLLPSLLKAAQATHPTTCEVLLAPGLTGAKMPKPPSSKWKLIDRGWNYNWPTYEKLRQRARDQGIGITAVASLDHKGKLGLHEKFFVPTDRYEDVAPRLGASGDGETQEQREARWAAERRNKGIQILAARMAADENAIAKVEGRRFWADQAYINNRNDAALGMCIKLDMVVLVTEAEVAAKIAAATADYDAHLQREAENKAAQEKAEERAALKLQLQKERLLAQSPAPAVIMVDGTWYYRWAEGENDGAYWDEPENPDPEADVTAEEGAEDLAQLLMYADTIGSDYDTVEAFRAAHPESTVTPETLA